MTVPIAQALELYRWIDGSPGFPLDVGLALRLDPLSAAMLFLVALVAGVVAVSAASAMRDDPARRRFFGTASLLVLATAMLLVSANFLAVFFFWQLMAVGAWLLIGLPWGTATNAAAAQKMFLMHLAADVVLAFGIFLIWTTFGSLEFSEVIGDAGRPSAKLAELFAPDQPAEQLRQNQAVVTAICLCLFAGAMGRCAQFPLFGWLNEAAHAPATVNALLQAASIMPAGVYLVARCAPLFEFAPEARSLMAFVGAFTALLASGIALTGPHWKHVLSHSAAAHLGLMFLGLGSGQRGGIVAAVFLVTVHALAQTSLFLTAAGMASQREAANDLFDAGRKPVRPWEMGSFLVGILVLASGLWGQHAILATVWEVANRPVATPGAAGLYSVSFWLAMFSLLLIAFALFRPFFLTFRRHESVAGEPHPNPPPFAPLRDGLRLLPAGIAAMIGPLLGGPAKLFDRLVGNTLSADATPAEIDMFMIGPGILLAMLGAVCAWMLYARLSDWPEQMAAALGPLTRLSRNRFYLDDFFRWCVVLPIGGAAALAEVLDRFLIGGLLVALPAKISALWSRATAPLRTAPIQFQALSLLLAAALLLAAVLWLR